LGIDLRDRFEQIRFPNLTRLLFLIEFESKLNARQRSLLQSELEAEKVFEEMSLLEKGIRQKLTRNRKEAHLLRILEDFKLLEKFMRLELTHEEYQKILMRRQAIERRFPKLHPFCRAAFRFYRLAGRRDRALFENALKESEKIEMRLGKKPILVLVTGGFHTSGLTRLMKERTIPYAVVAPRITKTDSRPARYHELMSGKWFSSHSRSESSQLSWARLLTENYGELNRVEEREMILRSEIGKSEALLREFYCL
jgi:hypothetical protein